MTTGKLSKLLDSPLLNKEIERREYIGASSIGGLCERAIWYGYHTLYRDQRTPRERRTLEIGHRLETLLVDSLREMGMRIDLPSKDNAFLHLKDKLIPEFQGHVDGVLIDYPYGHKAIIEIKTARDSSFRIFEKKGLMLWYPVYYAQVQSYMGMSGIHEAYVIAINKDTSEIHDEQIYFDELYYEKLRQKAKKLVEMDEAPVRLSSSPLYFVCRMCSYRSICHT